MNLTFTSKALDKLAPKGKDYITYHGSNERGTGRLGMRVYPTGKKIFVYRYFVGKSTKFQTLGSYPEMSLSAALAHFESLSVSKDMIRKPVKGQGTLAELFDAHEADYKAAGKRGYHHFISLRASIAKSGLLPESTIANKISSNDCREFLSYVYKSTEGKREWVNEVRSCLSALFGYGMRCDKSPAMETVNLKFDIPFNPVAAIPTLQCKRHFI